MKHTKRGMFDDFVALHDEMDRLFGSLFETPRPFRQLARVTWQPLVDVCETADRFVVVVELAGISPDRMTVTFDQGTLLLRGERLKLPPDAAHNYRLMEIACGPFERHIVIASDVDADGISAVYRDGLLEIVLPKRQAEPPMKRRVDIEVVGKEVETP